jgi:uncharacterized membrane protein
MATRTYTHLYDSHEEAAATVRALEAAGVPHEDISIVANNADNRHFVGDPPADHTNEAGAGATLGILLGGGAGIAAGLGLLAIPGVGPVVAAGWLVSTLAGAGVGAAGGGLLGALIHHGVPDQHAHVYAEGVRRGGALVTVRADDTRAAQIESVLENRVPLAVDPAARRTIYQQDAWSAHEPTAPAYTADQIAADRARRL